MKIYKLICSCFLYFTASCILGYVLLLFLGVRQFNHFVFVSHNVSCLKDTFNVTANMFFDISNAYVSSGTKCIFINKNTPRRKGTLSPKYSSLEDLSLLTGLSLSKIRTLEMSNDIQKNSLSELYTIVYFEPTYDEQVPYNEKIKIRDNNIIIQRNHMLGDGKSNLFHSNTIESVFKDAIKIYDNKKLLFDSVQVLENKSLCVISSIRDTVKVDNRIPHNQFFKWLYLSVAPYDITRSEHCFVLFSEAIDTLNLRLRFDEKVSVSPSGIHQMYGNHRILYFDDVTTYGDPKYEIASNYIYSELTKENFKNYGYYRQKMNDNVIHFWVKYESSQKLQWLRLFFLSSLLGLFITRLISSLIKLVSFLFKLIIKLNSKRK